jgi:hypothetical protein
MAEISNVFVVTEKPPKLGKITGEAEEASAQIRAFLVQRRQYIRRYADSNVKIPTLAQTMEEGDLDMLAGVALARFRREDQRKHPSEYLQRDREDQASSSSGSGSSDSSDEDGQRGGSNLRKDLEDEGGEEGEEGSNQNVPTATELIDGRLKEFKKQLNSEENILRTLRMMFGPRNILQADILLNEVKMDRHIAPYRSIQHSAQYAAQFEETAKWIQDFAPNSSSIREAFINGVHPPELRRQLKLLKIKNLVY